MVSNRYRGQQSLTNKIVNLDTKVGRNEKKRKLTLQTEPTTVTEEQIPNATIGTQQVGVINEVVSDSDQVHLFPADTGLVLSGGVYAEAIEEGGYSPLVLNSVGRVIPRPGVAMQGLLDRDYRGYGPARIYPWTTGVLSTEAYQWTTPYIPWGSRVVNLEWRGGTYVITGQTAEEGKEGKVRINLGSNLAAYNESVVEDSWSSPRVQRLSSGIVVLSGLVRFTATPSADHLLFTLPVGYRPDQTMLVYANVSDTARAIRINSNGEVRTSGTTLATGNYISLDGIAYPAAGIATWTNIGSGGSTWGANFEAWTDTATFGTPGFWQDPYGYVWMRGLVRVKVATSVDGTVIWNTPAGYEPFYGQSHLRTCGNEGYAGVAANAATNSINWKPASPGAVGAWISLSNVIYPTVNSSSNIFRGVGAYANGWGTYPGANNVSFPLPGVSRRNDGLCVSKGLINAGSLGSGRAFRVAEEMYTDTRVILDSIANNGRVRIDVSGNRELETPRQRGGVSIVNGDNTWVSLDGLKWMAG